MTPREKTLKNIASMPMKCSKCGEFMEHKRVTRNLPFAPRLDIRPVPIQVTFNADLCPKCGHEICSVGEAEKVSKQLWAQWRRRML